MPNRLSIFWFRRDIRLDDNAGLYHALRSGQPVLPIFIFDTDILNDLKDKKDKRVSFIHFALEEIQKQLLTMSSTLHVLYGRPLDCFKKLCDIYSVKAVYTNHDYEPYAKKRDEEIAGYLKSESISFNTYKDQVIFEKDEVLKDSGGPYTVFTPYSRKWKEKLDNFYLKSYPTGKYFGCFYKQAAINIPGLESIGFAETEQKWSLGQLDEKIAANYDKTRDTPGINGTTRLSLQLRFGTMSIRKLACRVLDLNTQLLNELIWREFYQMILWHFPHVIGQSFKKEYDKIEWRNNEKEFESWCKGQTGYPIVDAGMRELNETGFMHNRVRMITASFLTKHLLIDWRWGEAYFAEKLLDYDLASNNGGWQWAAGCGCDAAPYFRIFNPYLQTEKFDPELVYIKKWVSEFRNTSYPFPIVDHRDARERCLSVYKVALNRT